MSPAYCLACFTENPKITPPIHSELPTVYSTKSRLSRTFSRLYSNKC
nr:MAG TPA: hypothetical protein [Caudoviricetes sp.]